MYTNFTAGATSGPADWNASLVPPNMDHFDTGSDWDGMNQGAFGSSEGNVNAGPTIGFGEGTGYAMGMGMGSTNQNLNNEEVRGGMTSPGKAFLYQ